jgi:hypothetical protein
LLLKIILCNISHSDIAEVAPEVAPDASGIVVLEVAGALTPLLGFCALSKK